MAAQNPQRLAHCPSFVIRSDPSLPVHLRQWYEFTGRDDGVGEVWCYTDSRSYVQGDTVTLHACASVDFVDVTVYSTENVPTEMFRRKRVKTIWAETPENCSVVGCRWPAVFEFDIGAWPSGAYRVSLAASGNREGVPTAEHLFVVRPMETDKSSRLLLITSDATWNAYNDWGGSNAYEGIVDPQSNRFSAQLSIHRPMARGFVSAPIDAPRTLPFKRRAVGSTVEYPYMQWAYENGYSKKFASAGWASYERHFVHWAQNEGFQVDVATQQDLHFRPEVLSTYPCVAMVGHDEYWSWAMRDAIDNYIAAGGRVARFAGNFLWQIRLEDGGVTQICHKYRARDEDPLRGTVQQHLTTDAWESKEVGRAGVHTFGLNATNGMYAGWGDLAPHGPGGFTLFRPEHWAFDHCGLNYGDVLGGEARVFGYEVDGLPYTFDDGLPVPLPSVRTPENLQILAMGFARMRELACAGEPPDAHFVGQDDALFMAQTLYESADEEKIARTDRGSGMVVHFNCGKGEVFHAGTTEWVAGLMRRDFAVCAVTRNVLRKFLQR
ncbi:MAG: N,N-dimethylformamidase beta subunit family domain-containing protein [Pseudomonadota bacterium]